MLSGNDVRAMQVAVILGDGEKEDAGEVIRYTYGMTTVDRAKVLHYLQGDYFEEVLDERLEEMEGEDAQEEAT